MRSVYSLHKKLTVIANEVKQSYLYPGVRIAEPVPSFSEIASSLHSSQ